MFVGSVHKCLKQILEHVRDEHIWKVLKLALQSDQVHLFLGSPILGLCRRMNQMGESVRILRLSACIAYIALSLDAS